MDEDITRLFETLAVDSDRCGVQPVASVRRRGDRRRTAVRVAATGSTVVVVGATAGAGYALAQGSGNPASQHVGFATTSSAHPGSHSRQHVKHAKHRGTAKLGPGLATPTATPTSPWPAGLPSPGSTDTPSPGTPTASSSPTP
jgi:hypothetical protein